MNLSVCIATYNEEKNIEECLDGIKDITDEIIIVDGNSTDATVEMARKYTNKIYKTKNNPIFHIQKQMAIEKAKARWILQLDADERVTRELSNEIKKIISQESQYNGFWIKRKKQFLGKWIRKGGQYPDPVIRLFKNGTGRLPQKSVHEQIHVDGSVGWLTNDLIHLPTPTFSVYITKDNRYSTLFANEFVETSPQTNTFGIAKHFLIVPTLKFLSMYIRHKGFLDGFPGFVFAFYSALTYASAYVKYWEFKNSPTVVGNISDDWA
jgi:glycosyltransferase involved in cell wall biosynthesis